MWEKRCIKPNYDTRNNAAYSMSERMFHERTKGKEEKRRGFGGKERLRKTLLTLDFEK